MSNWSNIEHWKYLSTSKAIGRVIDDVVQDVLARVERNVSAKMDGLKELLSGVLSCRAKETCVREESDAVKVLLSGMEIWFWPVHGGPVEVNNAHTSATRS